ncbi:shikimate dehydrogenase [Streptomyces aurantiacus]|nr:shikimate dehydrogenase [Streptomyces aurantiacus]
MAQSSYLVGLIGSDTEGSLTVDLHEREAHRYNLRYLSRCVDTDGRAFRGEGMPGLLRACRNFGFSGLRVAPPHRHSMAPYLDELSPSAARLKAVDVIVFTRDGRTVGHSTEVACRIAAMGRGLPGVPLSRVVQLGAGTDGIAVAHALLEKKVERLLVTDPAPDRARTLTRQLNQRAGRDWAQAFITEELTVQLEEVDGLVNTLPSGKEGCLSAPLFAALHKGLWIFDAHRHPFYSPLLRAGNALGCLVLDTDGVLVNEAAAAFQLVTGLIPHTSHMFGDFADIKAEPQVHT